MQRRCAAELLHLRDREIANADHPNLALSEERVHGVSSLFDWHERIRPMDLIDIAVIRAQSPQGILDLAQDAFAACLAERSSVSPIKADLRGDEHAVAHCRVGESFADN